MSSKSRFVQALAFLALPCGLLAQNAGVEPEWEVRNNVKDLSAHVEKLKPLLDQIHTDAWVKQGASATYQAQWKTAREQVDALALSTGALSREPEKLSAVLDTLFRMEGLQGMMASLATGVRRYQNPAVADLIMGVLDESSSERQKLRQYALDLAVQREQEFKIVDREAQRCRGSLVQQPVHRN